jgi:hypothetical protein
VCLTGAESGAGIFLKVNHIRMYTFHQQNHHHHQHHHQRHLRWSQPAAPLMSHRSLTETVRVIEYATPSKNARDFFVVFTL